LRYRNVCDLRGIIKEYIKKYSMSRPLIDPTEILSEKTIFQGARDLAINYEEARLKCNRKESCNVVCTKRVGTNGLGMIVETTNYSIERDLNCES
jgi:hypothetical protein